MNDKVTVVLLGHKARAGKDTTAEFVEELGFKRAAFADKLKHTVMDLYNFSNAQMFGDEKEIQDERYPNLIDAEVTMNYNNGEYITASNPDYLPHFTPRRILQLFGQQQRSLNPDIWAAYVFNSTLTRMMEEGCNKVGDTDFRFKNEAVVAARWAEQDPENRSLYVVKVHRPGVFAGSGANDISEIDLDDYEFQHTILNDGSLEDLKNKALHFFNEVVLQR